MKTALAAIVAALAALFLLVVGYRRRVDNQPQRQSDGLTIGIAILILMASTMVAVARPSPYPPVTPFVGDRYGSAQLGPEVTRSIGCPPPACQRKRAGKARYLYPTRKRAPVSRQKWRLTPMPAPRPLAEPGTVEPLSVAQGAWQEVKAAVVGASAPPSRFIGGRLICARNVNAALAARGIKGTGSAWAKSFLTWGRSSDPVPGAVAVYSRGGNPRNGHAAIVAFVRNGVPYVWNPSRRGWRLQAYHKPAISYRVPS